MSADLVHDVAADALRELFTPERIAAADRRSRSELIAEVGALRRSLGIRGTRLSPPEAAPFLVTLRARLEDYARRQALAYGPYRWLWYLRRVPDSLTEGRVRTTLPYTLALAEVLTDRADDSEEKPLLQDHWISFKVDEHVARHILTLVCRTRRIFGVHRLIRTTGKGCPLLFDAQGYPSAECTDALERSMVLFDDRVASSEQLLSRAGTSLPLSPSWTDTDRALLACFRMDPQYAELPAVRDGREQLVRVRAQFQPVLVSSDSLKAFNTRFGQQQWWQPEAVALTLLLALCTHLLFEVGNAAISLAQLGYLAGSADVVRSVWNDHWAKAVTLTESTLGVAVAIRSPDDLLEQLRGMRGRAWPLVAASPVRGANNVMALDLNAATSRLATAFEFPPETGPVANVRAAHFEDEVQHVINASPWNPQDALKALRGRTLRRHGLAVTDVDAVGEKGGTLLLVSAKSKLYTSLYDTGDYVQVRNSATAVQDAVAHWRVFINSLVADPRGDNYDFSSAERVIGLVCTPHVVWVQVGDATEEVAPGLRAASSLEELEQWLASA